MAIDNENGGLSEAQLDHVWAQLKEARAHEISARAFLTAVKMRYVDEFLQGDLKLQQLADKVTRIQAEIDALDELDAQTRDDARSSQKEAPAAVDYRPAGLAQIFATEAAELEEVSEFRERHLRNGLLAPEDIGSWIEGTGESDGSATSYVKIPLDDHGQLAYGSEAIEDRSKLPPGTSIGLSFVLLAYVAAGDESVRYVPVRAVGVLGALKRLASRLSNRYGWSEALAVSFLLTGETPPPMRARVQSEEPWPWWRARQSIQIEVPLWTSPAEVERLYRETRTRMLRGDKRPRDLSRTRADLATFAYRYRRGYTWEQLRHFWNQQHPDDEPRTRTLFGRDCRQAFQRITGQPLPWEGRN